MTLKEAAEAAIRRLEVVHQGVTYERITQIGYKYGDDGIQTPYVRLRDRWGHSFTDADPKLCKLASEEAENKEKDNETTDNR